MQIAELKFGDVGRGMSRYRPVGLAVAAVVVMGLVLPGPARVVSNTFGASGWTSAPVSAAGRTISQVPEAAVPDEASSAFEAIESSSGSVSSSFTSGSSSASSLSSSSSSASSFTSDASVTRPSDSGSESEAASSSTPTFSSSTPPDSTPSSTGTASAAPLTVTEAAWASAQAGTPLASAGVPSGALPVGRRPGFSTDKASFVRLSGGADVLRLAPHADAAGHRSGNAAAIQVCRVTTADWEKAEARSFADAPKWDCAVSVLGVRADDGSWSFDLSVFPDPADDRGFALLPAGSGADFQVAFTLG